MTQNQTAQTAPLSNEQIYKAQCEAAKSWPAIPVSRSPDGTPVTIKLVADVGSRGDFQNKIYYNYPSILVEDENGKVDEQATKANLGDIIGFLGLQKAATLFQRMLTGISQNAYWEATHNPAVEETRINPHSGKEETITIFPEKDLDKEELIRYHEQQSAAGEPIADLKARREELVKKLGSLVAKSTNTDGTINMDIFTQVKKISAEVAQLSLDIDSRKRGPRKDKSENSETVNA